MVQDPVGEDKFFELGKLLAFDVTFLLLCDISFHGVKELHYAQRRTE